MMLKLSQNHSISEIPDEELVRYLVFLLNVLVRRHGASPLVTVCALRSCTNPSGSARAIHAKNSKFAPRSEVIRTVSVGKKYLASPAVNGVQVG